MVPRARARKIINLLQQKPKINISGFLFVREELKCDIKVFLHCDEIPRRHPETKSS